VPTALKLSIVDPDQVSLGIRARHSFGWLKWLRLCTTPLAPKSTRSLINPPAGGRSSNGIDAVWSTRSLRCRSTGQHRRSTISAAGAVRVPNPMDTA
jgi:hypothetical protein